MNRWQEVYCKELYGGKMPRSKRGKLEFELLGSIEDLVVVDFPERNGKPPHTETYEVTETDCDMPNGKVSVEVLASNLALWVSRGWKVTTKSKMDIADRLYSIVIERFKKEKPDRNLTKNDTDGIWYDIYGRLCKGESESKVEEWCKTTPLN